MTHSWWQDAAVYQVYIRSFADSNSDGIGDLEGIRSKLPYLANLGVDGLWITPFYPSPMHDHGYDVADYCDVDPMFGSLAEFDELLAGAHEAGLRVLVDLVPNHTSSEHPWFKEALADPTGPRRDWYMFREPAADGGPPNNWESVFGGPAWTLDAASGQYYLHLFDSSQPDLNWRNPEVHAAWEQVLRFWLDRGVDGFRIDVAHGLYKHPDLIDNVAPVVQAAGTEHLTSIGSKNNWDQPEVLEVYRRWREICDEYDERVMVGEVFLFDLGQIKKYVGRERLHQSFNFLVMATDFDADHMTWSIAQALDAFGMNGSSPTWVLSNHDLVRHTTRYGGGTQGQRRARAITSLLMALPGAVYLYQGEELGLEESDVPGDFRQDPIWVRSGGTVDGRDGCRTPLPWTAELPGHGFTTGTPWLPFGADARVRDAETQQEDDASMLAFYSRALESRRSVRRELGDVVSWLTTPARTLGFCRALGADQVLCCLLNTSAAPVLVPLDLSGAELVLTSADGAELTTAGCLVPAESTVWFSASSLDGPGSSGTLTNVEKSA